MSEVHSRFPVWFHQCCIQLCLVVFVVVVVVLNKIALSSLVIGVLGFPQRTHCRLQTSLFYGQPAFRCVVCCWKGPFRPSHLDCPMHSRMLFDPLTILVSPVKCGVHKGSLGKRGQCTVSKSVWGFREGESQGLTVLQSDPMIRGSQVSQAACVQCRGGQHLHSQNLSNSQRHFFERKTWSWIILACCLVLSCLHQYSALS